MRLWLDEMISGEVAKQLRRLGHDVPGVQEPEWRWASGLSDTEQLEVATRQRRVLATYDVRHFVIVSQAWAQALRQYYGILLIQARTIPQDDIGGLVRSLAHFLDAHQADDALSDRVVFLQAFDGAAQG